MKNKEKEKSYSEIIALYCNLVSEAQARYRTVKEDLERLEMLTQDYLHALELGELSYHERAKIATQLAECRKERRIAKDLLEVLEPFIQFADEKESKAYVNKLRQVLGSVRTAEKKHSNRIYVPRVLADAEGLYGAKEKEKK
ncbi:MAG: hypothetical protein E7576_06980 [Ruminococcaceae bacterium]|nr:hypothetical protein [Oscillospiraceae bacterium]